MILQIGSLRYHLDVLQYHNYYTIVHYRAILTLHHRWGKNES